MRGRAQVAGRAERLDLRGELAEEVGDLVEPVAVLDLDLAQPALAPLEAGDPGALADGFVTSAAVLRSLQADPLLPRDLLPTDWPGDALRGDYDRYDAAYRSVLRAWFAGGE